MRFWQSVRFKIVVGFFLVLLPIVAFVIYNNLYAIRVVKEQISSHYNILLAEYVRNNDKSMLDYYHYLINLEREQEIQALPLLETSSDEYTLSKTRLREKLAIDSIFYSSLIDTFFVYSDKSGELVYATQYVYNSLDKLDVLSAWAKENVPKGIPDRERRWDLTRIAGQTFLMKTHDLGFKTISGALIQAEALQSVMNNFDVGQDGATFLLDADGRVLTETEYAPLKDDAFMAKLRDLNGVKTGLDYNGESYIVLTQPSQYADIRYTLMMKESYILKNLPFFQKVLNFWMPLSLAVILSIYLLFLQRVMFQPFVRLIRGMRKLGQGQFDTRLPALADSSEFSFLSGTFNKMAEQIESLKIDVYEEQLRLQRAEYKHLQIQINPHFYMNSLNIIYNLAALKDFKTVQKLSLHLADYFRFLMLGHRTVVRLEDEIRHIEHYLEIQKIRYVNKLEYAIDVSQEYMSWEISPLMLQPFIENSVIHGLNKRVQDGTPFRISIRCEDDADEPGKYALLSIEDNGPGFPDAMLAELNASAYVARSAANHLGIWNVLRRFKMLYGGKGDIVFRNGEKGGACVLVKLPRERDRSFEIEENAAAAKEEKSDADDAGR
ncbi:two-component system sensor histidine kinase YesM [Cohnella sp. SGD-V74]|uniref:cache domain-containing sensor histidine kinase n=1 Tax=unclassified Cohnella TaxID=2636738 RepID=UPI000D4EC404|nr:MULTISPECIES: sensor histidine kinase [unclassified Cohnella]PRX69770.1 two-component system sensor histidine kinase YesM [Cohnella sp. SGD-V74]